MTARTTSCRTVVASALLALALDSRAYRFVPMRSFHAINSDVLPCTAAMARGRALLEGLPVVHVKRAVQRHCPSAAIKRVRGRQIWPTSTAYAGLQNYPTVHVPTAAIPRLDPAPTMTAKDSTTPRAVMKVCASKGLRWDALSIQLSQSSEL